MLTDDEQGWITPNNLVSYGIGMLGATASAVHEIPEQRLLMIERRLLRIEMAMRRAGIEVEMVELPAAPTPWRLV